MPNENITATVSETIISAAIESPSLSSDVSNVTFYCTITVPSSTVTQVGIQGPQGIQGIQGIQGEPGLAGVSFEFRQDVPATLWTISHNLNRFPSVTIVNSAGSTVWGDITYIDSNNVTISFSAGFSGKAYLN